MKNSRPFSKRKGYINEIFLLLNVQIASNYLKVKFVIKNKKNTIQIMTEIENSVSKSSSSSLQLPEKILHRIFDLINQVRKEFDLYPLAFNKELSFLAGEHACNMSTNLTPYGHGGFQEREAHVPNATAFSENIALVPSSDDPAQNIVVAWLKKSKSFSRILSCFTHTGIGIAESEDGSWYCTQIFATFKVRLSYKDQFLLMARFINRFRFKSNLIPLAVSLSGAAKMIFAVNENSNFLNTLTRKQCQGLFYGCSSADFIIKKFTKSTNFLNSFIDELSSSEDYLKMIEKPEYTDFIFTIHRKSETEADCVAVFGVCTPLQRSIPSVHSHFPEAYSCLQIINDYRIAHSIEPFELSHQWCTASIKHAKKMMTNVGEVEVRSLKKKILHRCPEDEVHCAACVIPNSFNPLRELLLIWISNPKTKALLLSTTLKHFGFGISILDGKFCYAVRVIGTKKMKVSQKSVVIKSEPNTPQYLPIPSDDDDTPDNLNPDANLTFKLTG